MSIESPHGFESPHGLRIARRQLLLGAGALPLALGASTNTARAQGRIVPGGRISMRLPWSLGTVDPHRRDDMAAALFAPCLFDSLYARDESGAFIPALAEDVPTVVTATPASADVHGRSAGLLVKLRTGLRTAKNRALTPEDIVFSLQRARALEIGRAHV